MYVQHLVSYQTSRWWCATQRSRCWGPLLLQALMERASYPATLLLLLLSLGAVLRPWCLGWEPQVSVRREWWGAGIRGGKGWLDDCGGKCTSTWDKPFFHAASSFTNRST